MIGKMEFQIKNVHDAKPSEMTLVDGTTRQSVMAKEDPKGEVIRVRRVKV